MRNILYLLIIVFLNSCFLFPEKENIVRDENGTVIRMNPLWVHPLTDSEPLGHGVRPSVVNSGKVFLLKWEAGRSNLILVNPENGDVEFSWNESERFFDLMSFHIANFNNKIVIGSNELIAIDAKNQKLIKYIKPESNLNFWSVTNVNEKIYSTNFLSQEPETGYFLPSIVQIDLESGNVVEIVTPNFPEKDKVNLEGSIGRIVNILGFVDQNKEYLVVFYQDNLGEGVSIESYMALYSLSDQRWIFDAYNVSEGSNFGAAGFIAKIHEGKVYFANNSGSNPAKLQCHDILTGEKIWEFNFNGNFFDFFDISEDGILVVNNAQIPTTVGIDANTGSQLWRVETGGTAGPVAIMNGVAYFAGASDGRLNAIDIYTGKFLYRLQPPPGTNRWKRHIAVVPEESRRADMIVATTSTHYMAFPAAR